MNLIAVLLIPSCLAIIILPWLANRILAGYLSAFFCFINFILASILSYTIYYANDPLFFFHQWFFCDKLSAFFILLNNFIGMTTSFYAISYLTNENKLRLNPLIYRFYYSFFQLFLLGLLVVIISNNIAIMWIAMELATISSVVLVGLYHTSEALEAAWKYLILCGVGIGLALLGTVILYFGAYIQGMNENGLLWTHLIHFAPQLPIKLLTISFIFIFVGYGTKVGFVPLHNWLPDAYAESYPMINALSSGSLLNVALLVILRFKLIFTHTQLPHFPSYLLLIFGFLSLFFSALSLFRQRQLKRLLAYSSIEHMSLISIAFGIGTPLALLAGLLHICMHSLSKAAAFLSSGNVMQITHTQTLSKIRGLFIQAPITAALLLISMLIVMGLPPSGLFISELLLMLAILKTNLWLFVPLILGLSLAFLAILLKIQPLFFAAPRQPVTSLQNTQHAYWPIILHLLLVIAAGIYVPLFLFSPVAHVIAGALL